MGTVSRETEQMMEAVWRDGHRRVGKGQQTEDVKGEREKDSMVGKLEQKENDGEEAKRQRGVRREQ